LGNVLKTSIDRGKRVKNAEQTLTLVKFGLPREEELCRHFRPTAKSFY